MHELGTPTHGKGALSLDPPTHWGGGPLSLGAWHIYGIVRREKERERSRERERERERETEWYAAHLFLCLCFSILMIVERE